MTYRTRYQTFLRNFSSAWKLQRDKDKYANRAVAEGMRSRAAYKLEELNDRFGRFLRHGANVVDLGAAPGGFSLLAAKKIHLDTAIDRWNWHGHHIHDPENKKDMQIQRTLGGLQKKRKFGKLICVDLQPMEPIMGATFVQGDMKDAITQQQILSSLNGEEADIVLSDMAPFTTGDKQTNHIRVMQLAEEALDVTRKILRNGGTFCCKIFRGSDEIEFRKELENQFLKVKALKPSASKKESTEMYYVAQGYVPDDMKMMNGSGSVYSLLSEDEMTTEKSQ